MNALNYKNKRVVVTGCYSGIGRAVAQQLIDLGAQVYGVDLLTPKLSLARFAAVDFRDPLAASAAAEAIDAPVDALFNCAGLGPTHDADPVLRVNFFATRAFSETLAPAMAQGGAIASVASIGGAGWPQHMREILQFLAIESLQEALQWYREHSALFPNAYSFTKEAVVVWTKLRATELIHQGVRINCTSPGATRTPMMDQIERELQGFSGMDAITRPIGRCSSPQEQAWPLLILNSELCSYVNGVDLAVDGGGAALAQITNV